MIFKVSEKIKGSCVLPTLNRVISEGMELSITGNDLYQGDIKSAIKNGVLVPSKEKYTEEMSKIKPSVILINKTDRVLILGDIVLKPKFSLSISKEKRNDLDVLSAEKRGLIEIVSDEKKVIKEKVKKEVKEKLSDYVVPESGEDIKVKPVIWDFREQEIKDAQVVPKAEDIVKIEDEDIKIDFIDEKEEEEEKEKTTKKTTKKPTKKMIKKKTITKKAVKKTTKKKETTSKNRKVRKVMPVGEKKEPKNVMDAAIELDSRGNPLVDKPSDTLQHLVDEVNAPEDISFADQEQAKERYNKRNDMG